MQADSTKDAFAQEQIERLENRFRALGPSVEHGYDKGTVRTVAAGIFALGLAASAFLYSEIGAVRDQVQDNHAALARVEAILDERMPRDI